MGAKKGRVPWNKGLTKHTDERLARMGLKLAGKVPWSKGLTAKTDERLARMIETLKGRRLSEEHKKKISVAVRRFWTQLKINDPELWKARLLAWHATTAEYWKRLHEAEVEAIRTEYGIPEDEQFVPVRYSEHLFARSLISGSKADVPARQHKRFYYPYRAGIYPSEDEEFGFVDGELVPLVTINGVTKAREEKS